jgi:hypothetical protein
VTTLAGCAWTATANDAWLTVTSGASGNGNGTVAFSAAANPTITARTGTLTIGGVTFSVNEAAASCTYTLSPTSQSMAAAGGTGSVGVTTLAGCAWTAAANDAWLTVTSGASGSGNGTVSFTAAANPTTTARSGTLSIGGVTFTVSEDAASCTYSLSATSQSVGAGGGTGSVGVTTLAGCPWTASANDAWLTVTSGASGTGNGTVAFSAAANPGATGRSGTLTIGGVTFTVNEAAASCTYSLSATSQSMVAAGGTGSVDLTTIAGCAWTAASNDTWLTVTSAANGTGNATVAFSAAANPATIARSGTLTIGGVTFTVNQDAASCTYSLSPTGQSMTAAGGTGSVGVTALTGCAWTAVSNATWLTVTSGASGSGNGTVAFSAAANSATSPRTGTLTIGGVTFTLDEAANCTFLLSGSTQVMAAQGGTGSVTVSTKTGCAWTATSNSSWLTVTSGASGSGSGTVTFSATANTGTATRSAIITIGGQTLTVNQPPCSYFVTPLTVNAGASATTGTITVNTTAGCGWTTSGSVSWLTLTGSASASGSATYTLTANTAAARTAKVVVAGQQVTINQAAGVSPATPGNLRVVGGGQ